MRLSVRDNATAWAVLLLLLAVSCGGSAPQPGAASPEGSLSPAPTPEPAAVLDFEARKLGGGVLRGADYAGKDVALWFWAPW